MTDILKLVKQARSKLIARPDTEHVQAYLRTIMSLPHLIYVVSIAQYGSPSGAFNLPSLMLISSSLLIGGLAFLGHIIIYPKINYTRRWVGIVYDMVVIGLTIFSLGDSGAPVFGMYIWVVIGNGFRYGIRFLYGAAALALLSFYLVAYFSPFYKSDVGLLVLATVILGLIIPIYFGSLLKKLQQNLVAAREADRLKTRFLSNVSHDLRTPLNAIMANCDLLGRELSSNGRHARRIHDMQEAATSLNSLLGDLLDVARIEAGRIKIISSRFNIIELLGRVTRFNGTAARTNRTHIYLTVAPGMPSYVHGDALRLEQVLNNIVSNAVKYTENGEVVIYARPHVDSDTGACRGIVCSITDTGIGMDPEALGRIFSRFEQADLAYARRYSGAGLGLNIANELTALMGGSIEVASTRGKGSCFTLHVPLRATPHVVTDRIFASQPPVAIVCANKARHRKWDEIIGGNILPNATVYTLEDLTHGLYTDVGGHTGTTLTIVDARELDIPIDDLPALASGFFGAPGAPRILVNAPYESVDISGIGLRYKSYRCWTTGDNPQDIRTALAIAYWTTGSEPSMAERDEELRSWMSALRGLTILVADDNKLNRHVLSDMLTYADAQVVEASNGAEALKILSRQHIDVALLDVQMPEMTGVEVLQAQVQRIAGKPVPALALTADTTEECRAKCLAAGANSILYKPVDMKTLYRELFLMVTAENPARTIKQPSNQRAILDQSLIDYALLHELAETGREPDYIDKLVVCFEQEGRQLLHGLRHAFSVKAIGDSRSLLHRLKGMCGTIGARQMAALCQESLALSDTELCASADRITTSLLQLYTDSALLLDTFSKDPIKTI